MAEYQTQRTVVAKQKLVLNAVDCYRLRSSVITSPPNKVKRFITRIKQALRVQRVRVDDLEPVHARDTQLCAQKVDGARLHGNVEFLVDPERIIPALQQLAERRLAPSAHILVNWLENLDRA